MGYEHLAGDIEQTFADQFGGYEYAVMPSGISTDQVRNHFTAIEQIPAAQKLRAHTYELIEFLHDVLQVDEFPWTNFPLKVAVHKLREGAAMVLTEKLNSDPHNDDPH